MKLNRQALGDRAAWEKAGYRLPSFDPAALEKATLESPEWIHFGAGNIFRAFPAAAMQRLLDRSLARTGIVACECFDGDIIDSAYRPFDNLSVAVTLKSDGTVDKTVVASVARALCCDGARPEDESLLRALFEKPSLQMVTFTITEKGYATRAADGTPLPAIRRDMRALPHEAVSPVGRLCALLLRRYEAGARPVALVSMDNCSHNGDKLRRATLDIAQAWHARGVVPEGYWDYITDETRVSFPWTMIDKITPRPDARVAEMLRETGFEDTSPIITEKHTYTAAFVNAEETEYLVVEDRFPNGRPPLEKAGLYFTDRDTVNRVERMKVCTCLNPLHTALAVLGCLMEYPTIFSEMREPLLRELVERIAYREGMPVVTDPGILSPERFAHEVIDARLTNPFMPDTPQRIATDTSQKLSIRFGETIRAYLADPALDVRSLTCIPFVFAAWIRYLLGVTDTLKPFAISPDPLLEELTGAIAGLGIGGSPEDAPGLDALLARADIFGVDLQKIGMSDTVKTHLAAMLRGEGAVRSALAALLRP